MLETAKLFINLYCLKDPHHKWHAERVQAISIIIGKAIGLCEQKLQVLQYAALLHDIGKALIPHSILTKEGILTEEEWTLIRLHPRFGYELLKPFAPEVAEAILYHHENWDGSGYPEGLKEDQIPLLSRIIRIADSIDAACSKRAYKHTRPLADVLEDIQKGGDFSYDPEIVSILGNGKGKFFKKSVHLSFRKPFRSKRK